MLVSAATTAGEAILLIFTVSCLLFTAGTLFGAERRRRELKRARLNGPRRCYANRVVRHEAFRFAKHVIIVAMVVATIREIPWLLQWRNLGIAVVGGLIGVNSLLDLIDRRSGFRGYLRVQRNPGGADGA